MLVELRRSWAMGDRTVYVRADPLLPEKLLIAVAELSRPQVAVGPPRTVGSSKDISIWTTLTDELMDAEMMTVVALATGFSTIVAVPVVERVTVCAICFGP